MPNIFITADHHFGHKNILKYQARTRPFDSVDVMNEQLIERHNKVVKKKDIVYFVGDFAFMPAEQIKGILSRLNGIKFLVLGNHDRQIRKGDFSEYFNWVKEYAEISIDGKHCVLFHYPIFSWNRMHHGAYHFYGHTHGQIPNLYHGRAMDVGVDTNNMYPHNMREIFSSYENDSNPTAQP